MPTPTPTPRPTPTRTRTPTPTPTPTPTATPSAKYVARANALVEALDIARALATSMPRAHRKGYATHLELTERMALDPAPAFAKLASLAYLESDFFTYWNEAAGKHVERFWREVAKRKLPFERRDVIGDVLERGRIKTRIEYELAVDAVGVLGAAKARKLSKLIGDYEQRAGRRR